MVRLVLAFGAMVGVVLGLMLPVPAAQDADGGHFVRVGAPAH